MWLKGKGKEVDKCLGNVELKAIKSYGAGNTLLKNHKKL